MDNSLNCIGNFMKQENTRILRGIAIMLVILGHNGYIYRGGAYGVTMFLILSGFGLTQSYIKNGMKGFVKKRLLNVFIPYSVVTLFWIVIDTFILKKYHSVQTVILSLIGLNFSFTNYIDASMWYITFLLLWYVAFYIIFKIIYSDNIKIFLLFILALIFHEINIPIIGAAGYTLYVLAFPLGALLGLNYSILCKIDKRKFSDILISLSIICVIIFNYCIKDRFNMTFYTLSNFSMSLIIISFSIILVEYLNVKVSLLSAIGDLSYELYLFEWIFIVRFLKIYSIAQNNIQKLGIYFIVVFGFAIALKFFINLVSNNLIYSKRENLVS